MTALPRTVPERSPSRTKPQAALGHLRRRRVVGASIAAATARRAVGQDLWPQRPVRLVLPFAPGFGGDLIARALAPHLSAAFGQPFVVENRPGAGGTIGTAEVARATDGHTLGVVVGGPTTTARLLNPDLPYDPAQDFRSVSLLVRAPFVLCVPASGPGDLGALLSAIRTQPGRLAYGSIGTGTVTHLAMEEHKARLDLDIQHVTYRGFPQVVADLLPGRIAVAMLPSGVATSLVRDGRLRGLAVTAEERQSVIPRVPTLAEAGIPDAACFGWTGMVAPAAFPADRAEAVAAIIRNAARDDLALRAQLDAVGVELVASAPAVLASLKETERSRWGAVIRRLNLRVVE